MKEDKGGVTIMVKNEATEGIWSAEKLLSRIIEYIDTEYPDLLEKQSFFMSGRIRAAHVVSPILVSYIQPLHIKTWERLRPLYTIDPSANRPNPFLS